MDKTLDQLAHDPTSSRFVKDIVELAQGCDLSDVANDLHVLAIAADNQCKQNYEIYLGVTYRWKSYLKDWQSHLKEGNS